MKQPLIHEYTRDFEITLEETMPSFLGFEIEQGSNGIDLHLDTYIKRDNHRLLVIFQDVLEAQEGGDATGGGARWTRLP